MIRLFSRFATIFALVTAAGLPVRPAGAQGASPSKGKEVSSPSFTNAQDLRLVKVKTAPSPAYIGSEQGMADAILGTALRDQWDQMDPHFHKGEYNHIINLSRIIVQGDPQNVEAYANASWLLWSTDRGDQAAAFLKQGLDANQTTYYLYDELGLHYFLHDKKPEQAIPYFEQAITFPCPYATYNSLANCYERTNQWDKAVDTWTKATTYPEDAVALVRLERAKQEVARRQH